MNNQMMHEQIMQSIVIERKNGFDELDSRNDDNCYTEESKEVPLEAILNKVNKYQLTPPMHYQPQIPSGYSASQDEQADDYEQDQESENDEYDIEAGVGTRNDQKPVAKKESKFSKNFISFQNDNTTNIDPSKLIKKLSGYIKSFIILCLVVVLLAIATRGIVLEIRQSKSLINILFLPFMINFLLPNYRRELRPNF